MPSNFTENYQLSQWSADDRVLRDDFNADNAKIDGALSQKAEAAALAALTDLVGTPLRAKWGSYTGTGTNDHTIEMGLRPRFAMVVRSGTYYQYALLLGDVGIYHVGGEMSSYTGNSEGFRITPTDSGLSLFSNLGYLGATGNAEHACNLEKTWYTWFALGE